LAEASSFTRTEGPVTVKAGGLDGKTDLQIDLGFVYAPIAQAPDNFYVLTDPAESGLRFGHSTTGELTAGEVTAQIGPLVTDVLGTVDVTGRVSATFNNPNGDDRLTKAEWLALGTTGILNASCSGSAAVDLRLQGRLIGLAPEDAATLTVNDTNLCAAPAPDVQADVTKLKGIDRVTPADLVELLQRTNAVLRAIQDDQDVVLPFSRDRLSTVVRVNDALEEILVRRGLLDPADRTRPIVPTPEQAASLDTLTEVAEALAEAGGFIAPKFRWVDGRLLLDLQRSGTTDTKQVGSAFGDTLQQSGLTGLDGAAKLTAEASYDLDVSIGIDLLKSDVVPLETDSTQDRPTTFVDRLFLDTAGTELTIGGKVTGDLDLNGHIGFLGVHAYDGPTSTVLLEPLSGSDGPLATVDLSDADGRLTLAELGNVLGGLDPQLTARVPSFTLTVDGRVGTVAPLATGTVTVAWTNVRDTSTLTVTGDTAFNETLLQFDFDHDNPRAMFGVLLGAARDIAAELAAVTATGELAEPLPVTGGRFSDAGAAFRSLRDGLDQLILANEQADLADLEAGLEQLLVSAFDLPPESVAGVVSLRLDRSTGVPTLVLALDFGSCTTAKARVVGLCKALGALAGGRFGFHTEGSSLVALETAGRIKLDYGLTAKIELGLELPEVVAATIANNPPAPVVEDALPRAVVLGSTPAAVDVTVAASTHLLGTFGTVAVGFGDAANPVVAKAHVGVRLGDPSSTARFQISAAGLPAFAARLVPDVLDVSALPAADCGAGPVDACAVVPIVVEGIVIGQLDISIPDVLDPSTWTAVPSSELAEFLRGRSVSWSLLAQGLDGLARMLEEALGADTMTDQGLPLFGHKLDGGAQVVADFRQNVTLPAIDLAAKLDMATTVGAVRARIQTDLGRPLAASGLLLDGPDADATVIGEDLVVVATCGPDGMKTCDDAVKVNDVHRFELRASLGRQAETRTALDLNAWL